MAYIYYNIMTFMGSACVHVIWLTQHINKLLGVFFWSGRKLISNLNKDFYFWEKNISGVEFF